MSFWGSLVNYFPRFSLQIWLLIFIVIFFTVIIARYMYCNKRWDKIKSCAACCLIPYEFILLLSTVFCRPSQNNYCVILQPFWTYIQIKNGVYNLRWEALYNILAFAILGIILKMFVQDNKRFLWIGIGTSVFIETSQLILKRGVFEIDDIIHNAIGLLLGNIVYIIFFSVFRKKK